MTPERFPIRIGRRSRFVLLLFGVRPANAYVDLGDDELDAYFGSVKTWLLAIVHQRAIDATRRRRPTTELPDLELPPPAAFTVPDVWAEVATGLDADSVREVLTVLSDVQREAIELAYFGGLTQREIADRTATPLGTVKSRMRFGPWPCAEPWMQVPN